MKLRIIKGKKKRAEMLRVIIGVCVLAFVAMSSSVQANSINEFSLFGGNQTTLGTNVIVNSGLVGSNANVTLGGGSDTLSVMGAGVLSGGTNLTIQSTGDVIFNGNVTLGGGSHTTGDVDSGGNVVIGTNAIVDGNVRAAGTVSIGGSATVGGDVDAGKTTAGTAVTLGTNAQVVGTITHKAGTTVSMGGGSSAGGDVIGTPDAPIPYVATTLPTATVFSAGATDITKAGAQTTTLLPGDGPFDDITLGTNNILNLSAGSYFFDTWNIGGGSTINFDLTSGNISLFFTGNVNIGTNLHVFLTGGDASGIYAETYGDWDLSGGGQWYGTIFGSAVGSDIDFGTSTALTGALIATRNLTIGGGSTVNLLQADYLTPPTNGVPEPTTLLLLGLGLVGLAGIRRKF